MTKRFTLQEDANTKHILLLIDTEDKVMWSFMATHKEAVEGVLKRLNEQEERIQELESKNRNAEHLINILEENKLDDMESSLKLFTENAKLKAKINELEEMVTDD